MTVMSFLTSLCEITMVGDETLNALRASYFLFELVMSDQINFFRAFVGSFS